MRHGHVHIPRCSWRRVLNRKNPTHMAVLLEKAAPSSGTVVPRAALRWRAAIGSAWARWPGESALLLGSLWRRMLAQPAVVGAAIPGFEIEESTAWATQARRMPHAPQGLLAVPPLFALQGLQGRGTSAWPGRPRHQLLQHWRHIAAQPQQAMTLRPWTRWLRSSHGRRHQGGRHATIADRGADDVCQGVVERIGLVH